MNRVAVASSTQLSADAGGAIGKAGGNAVDAAIAASLVAISTEPGICSVGCGGFITVWPADHAATTFDGNIEMPGRGLPKERLGGGAWKVSMDYGGGISTYVGHGSVGTPGGLAAYDRAWSRHGSLPWKALFEPAIDHARHGFALSASSYNYLQYSHDCVYGWLPQSHAALHTSKGAVKRPGDTVRVEHLAESLEAIARDGVNTFYRGDLANMIAADFEANNGVMTATDLAEYEVIERQPLGFSHGGWTLATNPAPAVGGVSLVAMLELLNHARSEVPSDRSEVWSRKLTARIADLQHRVLMHRLRHLDYSNELERDTQTLLNLARNNSVALDKPSASTVHTSAVDSTGLACAITMSSGYGAGVMPPGTGIWMNNCLGEIELNRKGLNAGPPGMRLASNMAPTAGRHQDGRVLAIGSPGADRITSALLCTFNNYLYDGLDLDTSIARPRLHLEINDGDPRIAYERGLDVSDISLPTREFAEPSMFFGGVGACLYTPGPNSLVAAADPRRSGGRRLV